MKEKGLSTQESVEKAKAQVTSAENGVAHAMQGLEEMELNFKRDIKRRKLQVEQSFVQEDGDRTHSILKPFSSSIESRSLRVDRLLLTPEKEDENDELNEGWGPGVDVEEEPNEVALESTERGSKRPPAVNSDFLPLPWKGRLGYVCG